MSNKLFLFIAIPFLMMGCKKSNSVTCNDTGVPNAAEITTLQNYLTAQSITAFKDTAGFFYEILAPGSGVKPTINSTVSVNYTGKFLDGKTFDSNAGGPVVTFPLTGVIRGWQLGVPLIKKGGSINLYLPPTLAYGCYDYSSIPGNSCLIFHIDLIDVK